MLGVSIDGAATSALGVISGAKGRCGLAAGLDLEEGVEVVYEYVAAKARRPIVENVKKAIVAVSVESIGNLAIIALRNEVSTELCEKESDAPDARELDVAHEVGLEDADFTPFAAAERAPHVFTTNFYCGK